MVFCEIEEEGKIVLSLERNMTDEDPSYTIDTCYSLAEQGDYASPTHKRVRPSIPHSSSPLFTIQFCEQLFPAVTGDTG